MELLLITAEASGNTRKERLSDASRVISVIDGEGLVDLCKEFGVEVKINYEINLSFLEEKEVTLEIPEVSKKHKTKTKNARTSESTYGIAVRIGFCMLISVSGSPTRPIGMLYQCPQSSIDNCHDYYSHKSK